LGVDTPPEFLVARSRPGRMVVARGDEAEAEPAPVGHVVEVRQRGGVLDGVPWAVVERRVEAGAALAAVLPVVDGRAGYGVVSRHAGVQVVPPGDLHAPFALLWRRTPAACPDDLPGAPAAGLVVGRGFGAHRLTV